MRCTPTQSLSKTSISRRVASIAAALALAATFAWLLWITQPYQNQVFTTDTVVYADTALHIAQGKGISTGIIHLSDSPPQIPQVSWPPLYPMLVAMVLKFGFSLPLALQMVPVIAAALGVVVLAYFLGKHFGWQSLLFFAALVLSARQVHRAGAAALTEGVFFGLLAMAQFLAMDLLKGAKKPWLAALLLGLIGGCMVALRYVAAGVPLALIALLFFRKQIASAAISALGFAAITIPLFLRNFVFLRQYQNGHEGSTIGFFENIRQTFFTIGQDLWRQPLILVALALSVLLIIFYRHFNQDLTSAWLPSLVMVLGLWGGTILARSFLEFDVIYSRFVVPGEFVLLAPTAITLAELLRGRVNRVAMVLAVLATIYFVRESVYAWNPDRQWAAGPKNEWIVDHTEPNSWIIGNQALEYAYFTHRTVTPLRSTNEPKTNTDLEALLQRLSQRSVPVYLVLADPYKPDQHTEPMVALREGSYTPDGLTRVESLPSLTVYRVAQ